LFISITWEPPTAKCDIGYRWSLLYLCLYGTHVLLYDFHFSFNIIKLYCRVLSDRLANWNCQMPGNIV
jgi:hypothetical protein